MVDNNANPDGTDGIDGTDATPDETEKADEGDEPAAVDRGDLPPGIDPAELLDALVDEGVLAAEGDGLATTEAFERDRRIYYDTYGEASDAVFEESIAEVFGLDSPEAARERIDALGITREEFATYLTLANTLEGYDRAELTVMAAMVADVGPESPVPPGVEQVDDDSYGAFLVDHERAVVTVWKRFCDPCDAMKERLDEVLAALPDDAAVAGLDGESCPAFREAFGVDAAPAVLLFEDGTLLETITGRTDPEPLEARCREVYSG